MKVTYVSKIGHSASGWLSEEQCNLITRTSHQSQKVWFLLRLTL